LKLKQDAVVLIDKEKAAKLEEKMRKNQFTLEDFMEQMEQVRNMGPMDELLGMLPGMGGAKQLKNMQFDEKQLDHIEAIISSMTPEERQDPDIINGSRRKRIAQGSGTKIQDVNRLLKQFRQTKKMMKQLNSGKMGKMAKGGFNLPF
jgi:signal recognition particle subunit SRP54